MQRLPLVELPPDLEARLRDLGGRPINLYRALANDPASLRAYLDFTWALRRGSRTPRRLRELMIVRGAQICGSGYELAHHTMMAKAAGVSEAELAELARWEGSASFAPAERAALTYMEETLALAVSDATFATLRSHFSALECVELTMTATFYAMVPRILQALGVPLDGPEVRLEADA